ncbi:MAG TPA: ATP-binding protein [Solirubrobacteraceae bacterium]|nr:ATP-binding protein [Solirubrobacteraceae bacterium]
MPLAVSLSARVRAEVHSQARGQADLVAATAEDLLAAAYRRQLQTVVATAARSVRGRILVVDGAGRVLVDSAGPAQVGSSYEGRPEIESALAGHPVQVQRASRTLGRDILATAVPIVHNGRPAGAVRITQSVSAVNDAVRRALLGLAGVGAVVLALGLAAGALIAAQVARPMRRLERVARRVADGDLEARAEVEGSSEQRSLAASFNDMTARIARLIHAQSDFVADASHQLRTPLTGLRLRLEEAKASVDPPSAGDAVAAPDPAAAATEIDAGIREVDRLAHTVEELLLLSRAGERQLAGEAVDLDRVADSAVDRWQATAQSRGIALTHAANGAAATAWCARPDLERALDTLIENGVQYAPADTAVTIATRPGVIEVRDRGPGVAPEERELVFERFHRGRAGRSGPSGSGLGLAIARELAREWNGEVTLEERTGGGTVARMSLPLGPERTSPAQ